MAIRAIGVALVLSSLPIAGCGTVANLANSHPEQGGRAPFGGVTRDVSCIKKAANGEPDPGTPSEAEARQPPQLALMLVCAADVPLSFLGDVVTWPYTASFTFINSPTPTPPVTAGPNPPLQQGALGGRPETPPEETLPEPRTLP